ncbi:MAG TPA: adenylate/guanylate cyclase domain-containing protein [Candidatus Nanopelagicales bacterium]|nr:adenylate/guanylate cyclase domain-containing protein [Candidatus Nanopelagicales bacterium]
MAESGQPGRSSSSSAPPPRPPAPLAGAEVSTRTHGFLFADLRDYTSYMDERGDHAGAELLRRYRALVRGAVAAANGAEIKTEGDSFYLVFDSASAAVRCGQEIIAAADAAPGEPIRVGVGVHAGETVETAEGYVGSAVNIAARLCAQAKAGELVVSDTVRALTRTYLDVEFEPLGSRRLKGVNEQIVLYRVVPHTATTRVAARRGAARRLPWLLGIGGVAVVVLGAVGIALVGGSGVSPTAQPSVPPSEAAVATPSAAASDTAPASAGPGGLTVAEQELLARVPLDFQPYCRRSSLPDGSLGGAASLRCDLQPGSSGYGADTVWYDAFDQPGLMAVAVNAVKDREKLSQGECDAQVTGVIGRWSMGITFTGLLACYTKESGAWMLWTYEGQLIAARAVRQDGDTASLYAWWKDVASPYLRY